MEPLEKMIEGYRRLETEIETDIGYQKLEVNYGNKDLKLTHEQCQSQCSNK